jgi:hypothetical protein
MVSFRLLSFVLVVFLVAHAVRSQDGESIEPQLSQPRRTGPQEPAGDRPSPGLSVGGAADGQQQGQLAPTSNNGPGGGGQQGRLPPASLSPQRPCRSIAQALRSFDFLSTFVATLEAAGMSEPLNDKNLTVTLLVPTNEVCYIAW